MENFKVIVAGCRGFNNYELVKERLSHYLSLKMQTHNVIIVSGHASGADSLGERFAKEFNLQLELHPADWEKYGNSAGPRRNKEMAECSDALVAFWDGKSRGTKSMIQFAEERNLFVKKVMI